MLTDQHNPSAGQDLPLPTQPPAIIVEGLSKQYGKLQAVDNVSFSVPRGEFFGFLGPNGAGKSTTIRVMCGLLAAQYSRIEIAGRNLREDPLGVKASIGVMLEEPLLYDRLSAREHLRLSAQLYGMQAAQAEARAEQLLRMLDLLEAADRLIVDYSQGMRKKTALAIALIHDPQVLFLDEPFNGIDTLSARLIKDMLKARVDEGRTIMFSSHVMEVVEKLCSSLAIINRGRLVFYDSLQNLRQSEGYEGLEELFIRAVGTQEASRGSTAEWISNDG